MLVDAMMFIPELGRSVIRGEDLDEFEKEVQTAAAVSALPPSSATCRELEACLAVMANLFLDAPLLGTKPQHQVQTVTDFIDFTGTALSVAAGTWRNIGAYGLR
jgi:hypothetical protein